MFSKINKIKNLNKKIMHKRFYSKVRNPFIKLMSNHIIFYPTPNNINYG